MSHLLQEADPAGARWVWCPLSTTLSPGLRPLMGGVPVLSRPPGSEQREDATTSGEWKDQ